MPTDAGQYRKVRCTDHGCTVYQCLWCLGTVEIRDDPNYGWNFCPKCGKSWFHRLKCREQGVPRWYYDRWGNGESLDAPRIYENRPQPTAKWVIEWRTKWFNAPWGEWEQESSRDKDPCNPDWQWVRRILTDYRTRHDDLCKNIKFEYRAKLVRSIR